MALLFVGGFRLFPTFDFVWNITGIILAATSRTCSDVMPDVYHSILAFASAVLGRIHAGTEAEDLVVSVFPSQTQLPNTAVQLLSTQAAVCSSQFGSSSMRWACR